MLQRILIFSLALLFLLAFNSYAGDYEYIGAKKCFTCHKGDKKGNQKEIWEKSGHANAFTELTSESGMKKAKELGVEDPTKSDKCLPCHSTGYGKDSKFAKTFDISEGVGCESCHGPGSEYKKMSIMKDREKAVAAGMIVGDEKTCLTCHVKDNPGHKGENFVYAEYYKKIAHPVPAEKK